ncbi:two component regulator with propeller domain [Tahibacter aquaticus]|uniref:Two component regulator with propeller domain n=1 Tax=Tahibacter aquaticus TaxID=520092 RepID=A0A4R6Z0G4_9GAMM|nr:sensor histidine kinase [Tahibacter aquaticus]TDR45010.1 two component regulator with propeller domain [Tahibacter aquaticus]
MPGPLRLLLHCLLPALLAGLCTTVAAAAPERQFRHTAWSVERGAPADIWALAQDRDGFLWLGTGNGLYRFDGVGFVRRLPAAGDTLTTRNITALHSSGDGSLWMGFFYGGTAVLRGDTLQRYGSAEGFPDGMVLALAQTRDGRLWAASRGGLVRFDGQRWQTVGREMNYPGKRADALLLDRDGRLWVATDEALVFLDAAGTQFEHSGIAVGKDAALAQAPDGRIWLSDGLYGTRPLPASAAEPPPPPPPRTRFGQAKRLLFDRQGRLWGSDANRGGIYRVADPARIADGQSLRSDDVDSFFGTKDGLTSDIAVPLLQDAEGSVWAGTNLGLNSFHVNNVTSPAEFQAMADLSFSLAGGNGEVWIANNGRLAQVTRDGVQEVLRGLPPIVGALYDGAGQLWLEEPDGLLRYHDGRLDKVALPPATTTDDIRALAGDGHGGLWAAFSRHGIHRWSEGRWTALQAVAELQGRTPTALASDAAGGLWLGHARDALARIDSGGQRLYGKADGLAVGLVSVIDASSAQVLVGGEAGLARLHGQRFQSLHLDDADLLSGISGIVRRDNGDLWLNTINGVVRVDAAEAERAFADPAYRAHYRLFDFRDGLRGVARQASITGTAAVDAAGRLWFVTNQGAAWIAPDAIASNQLPPQVLIESVVAGGVRHAARTALQLPAGSTNLRIAYTATSLAAPERVQFRYRLDGVDEQWQDAGNRREGFYTNLDPGHYRFRVIAANEDGLWNEQGASLDFQIAPRFYQRGWFYALCALFALAAALRFYFWRLHLAAEKIRQRFADRLGERERIARDLHDTLLQGIQGLLLRLQSLAAGLAPDDPRRRQLDQAVDQARVMLVEGRDKIVALRAGDTDNESFAAAVRSLGASIAAAQADPAHFDVSVSGNEQPICPPVCEELLALVREGLRNAFVHAQAERIAVLVAYEAHTLRVRIQDDGRGIAEEILRQRRRDGHWGLVGMHERAERLGGTLSIRNRQEGGSEIVLTVPRQIVFGEGGRKPLP